MARDFNQNRIANAILGQATIDKYGNTFAVQFGLDGINIANVTVQPMPDSLIPYLEGDIAIKQYAVPINVDELCDYALASFPNIEELTLFSLTMVTFDETNLLSYLSNLDTVYVPQSLLSAYQSAYPNITFDEITIDYTYVVEDYTQDHVLTSEIITEQLNDLTSQQRNAITKLVIASTYTSASVDNVLWGYNFGTLLPYLNNNIWYNSSKFDFSEYTIQDNTEDHILTASVVETELAKIGADKLTAIEKIIVPIDFTSYASGSITELQAFMTTNSIDKLVTTYEAGAMELSLSGDIVAKIVSIGKTLDEALVYARTLVNTTNHNADSDLIIVPPMTFNINGNYGDLFGSCSNLVYIDKPIMSASNKNMSSIGNNSNNLLYIKDIIFTDKPQVAGYTTIAFTNLKEIILTFQQGSSINQFQIEQNLSLTKLQLNGFTCNGGILLRTAQTKSFFVDLFNSLGTNTTSKFLLLGSTNVSTLTNTSDDDSGLVAIQNVYDKKWNIDPQPTFTFTIGSNTYSCDFGMTWEQWVSSAYNTDGYVVIGNNIYSSNYTNVIKLNGTNVNKTSLIKYGDEYSLVNEPAPFITDYQVVEYIESTGTQYIDTEITPNQDTKTEIKCCSFSQVNGHIFGIRQGGYYAITLIPISTGSDYNGYRLLYNNSFGRYKFSDSEDQFEVVRTLKIDSGKLYIDDIERVSLTQATFSCSGNALICAQYISGTLNICSSLRVYYCKMYNGNTKVRDFVPCYRKADGVIGLYDLVNATFYTNAGTGTFTKGSDI